MAKSKAKRKKNNPKIAGICGAVIFIVFLISAIARALGYDLEYELKKLLGFESKYNDSVQVHFIDVGQGDCIFIETADGNMLIDCGEASEADIVLNYLQNENIKKLDYVLGTHPHSDHMGGMSRIVENVEIGEFIMPHLPDKDVPTTRYFENLLIALDNADLDITEAETGDVISLGEAEVTLIAPNKENDNTNDYSVCAVLEHGKNSFIFTGDAERNGEKHFIDSGLLHKCTVYKAGHHGSSTSSSAEFLAEIQPEYTVIMCGEGNSYGHPHDKALKRIGKYTAPQNIYRTDLCGSIVFESDGESLEITTER